jgi:uncharacterized protein YbjT (DUF2867 family)
MARLSAVTGAFGYTGATIASRLLANGEQVCTLTSRQNPSHPLAGKISVAPLAFEDEAQLARDLEGCETLYNTYWVLFRHGQVTFERAIANTRTLIRAAERAGIRRIVHLSVTNPSLDSPLPYYRGKPILEQAVRASRLSCALLRPTVIFGAGDILLNNIAWLLRRFPLFVVPGDGSYKLQPVFLDDVAGMAVAAGSGKEDIVQDAAGPEVFSYNDLVRLIARRVGSRARIVHASPRTTLLLSRALGAILRDVLLTREEIAGLMGNLLVSNAAPTSPTRFSDWLRANAQTLGRSYASELTRHFR